MSEVPLYADSQHLHGKGLGGGKRQVTKVWGLGCGVMCSGSEAGSYLRLIDSVSLSLRLKDLLGPVTRVKKKRRRVWGLLQARSQRRGPRIIGSWTCVSLNSRLERNKEEEEGPRILLPKPCTLVPKHQTLNPKTLKRRIKG